MRTATSTWRRLRFAVPVTLLAAASLNAAGLSPAQAGAGAIQGNACVDDTGYWSNDVTSIQGSLAPASLGVGDTATMTGTQVTVAIDAATLKARAGSSLRVAPTLAAVGTLDPGSTLTMGQNVLSLATSVQFTASNASPATQAPIGNATLTFFATADGVLYRGTPDPAGGNTTLAIVSSVTSPVPLGDTSWVSTASGTLTVSELATPPADPAVPSIADRLAAPLTVHYALNGGVTPFTTETCWPGQVGTVPLPLPPATPAPPSLAAQTVPIANIGSPTVIHTLMGATSNAGINPTTVTVTTPPKHGTTTINPMTGDITYIASTTSPTSPADTFAVTVAATAPNNALVSTPTIETVTTITTDPLTAPSLAPQVRPVANIGSPAVIQTLAGATGNAGIDPASVTVLSQPAHGTATVNPITGDITYVAITTSPSTPADSFTVHAAAQAPNGTLVSAPTVESITAISPDRPIGLVQRATTPLATPISSVTVQIRPHCANSTAALGAGQSTVIDVLPTCQTSNGTLSPTSVQIVSNPTAGAVAIQPTTGAIVYSSTSTTVTSDSFTFKVVNSMGVSSNVATLSVQILGVACSSSCNPLTTTPVPIQMQAHQTGDLIALAPVTLSGDHQVVTGAINPVYVYNGSNSLGWSLTGSVSDFLGSTSGLSTCDGHSRLCIPAKNLAWQPSASVVGTPATGPAPTVTSGPGLQSWVHPEWSPVNGADPFTTTPSVLCSAPAASGIGTFLCKADLYLSVPASAGSDTYIATLTLTLS